MKLHFSDRKGCTLNFVQKKNAKLGLMQDNGTKYGSNENVKCTAYTGKKKKKVAEGFKSFVKQGLCLPQS